MLDNRHESLPDTTWSKVDEPWSPSPSEADQLATDLRACPTAADDDSSFSLKEEHDSLQDLNPDPLSFLLQPQLTPTATLPVSGSDFASAISLPSSERQLSLPPIEHAIPSPLPTDVKRKRKIESFHEEFLKIVGSELGMPDEICPPEKRTKNSDDMERESSFLLSRLWASRKERNDHVEEWRRQTMLAIREAIDKYPDGKQPEVAEEGLQFVNLTSADFKEGVKKRPEPRPRGKYKKRGTKSPKTKEVTSEPTSMPENPLLLDDSGTCAVTTTVAPVTQSAKKAVNADKNSRSLYL